MYVFPASDTELDQLLRMHQASRDALVDVHCRTTMKSTDSRTPMNLSGEFWKSGSDYRFRAIRSAGNAYSAPVVDTLFLNGRMQEFTLRQGGLSQRNQLIVYDKRPYQDIGNPWFFGLLVLTGPELGPFPLEELVTRKDIKLGAVEQKVTENGIVPIIHLNHASGECVIRLNPRYNYLIDFVEYRNTKADVASVHEVKRFKDVGAGLYFPELISNVNSVKGHVRETITTNITEIIVNSRRTRESLKLSYPRGTILYDMIRGVNYQVDGTGTRIGPETSNDGKSPARNTTLTAQGDTPAPDKIAPHSQYPQASVWDALPRGLGTWLVLCGVGILVALVILATVNRLRRSRDDA